MNIINEREELAFFLGFKRENA